MVLLCSVTTLCSVESPCNSVARLGRKDSGGIRKDQCGYLFVFGGDELEAHS